VGDPAPAYRRVLLKLSGEALSGAEGFGLDAPVLGSICSQVAAVARSGVQIAIVVGGGNFFRGAAAATAGIERATADYIGMLATVMNGLVLQQGLQAEGIEARVQSAIPMPTVSEPYVRQRALKHLDLGRVVVFAAGTGNPFFTTDTAASLRAVEIGADLMLKATKVDGVYDADPLANPGAKRYSAISYDEVLERRLGVMDATAIALCRENDLPLRVFAIHEPGSLQRVINGADEGTLVTTRV